MSRALFVSERVSLPCSQTFVRIIQATGLHSVAPACALSLSPLCTRHKGFECVNRDTRRFYPTYKNVSIETHAGSTPYIRLSPHETHVGSTPPSHCVPPQHNTLYHPDTDKCYNDVMWSASGFFIVSEVVSTHVSTVIKINRQNSEQW